VVIITDNSRKFDWRTTWICARKNKRS